jgi:hypothetical protein
MPFSASFGHFLGKSTQVAFHEQFTRTTGLFKSSQINPNQGKLRYFLDRNAPRIHHSNTLPIRSCIRVSRCKQSAIWRGFYELASQPQGCSKVSSKPPGAWKFSGFLPKAATVRKCSGGWQSAADFLCRRCAAVAAQLPRV